MENEKTTTSATTPIPSTSAPSSATTTTNTATNENSTNEPIETATTTIASEVPEEEEGMSTSRSASPTGGASSSAPSGGIEFEVMTHRTSSPSFSMTTNETEHDSKTDGSNAAAAAAAASISSIPNSKKSTTWWKGKTGEEPAPTAVLDYLRKRGLLGAALELQKHLEVEKKDFKRKKRERKKEVALKKKKKTTDLQQSQGISSSLEDGGDGGGEAMEVDLADSKDNEKDDKNPYGGDDDDDDDDLEKIDNDGDDDDDKSDSSSSMDIDEQMELYELKTRNRRTKLTLSTGGGIGYDLDSASSIAIWGSHVFTPDEDGTAIASSGDGESNADGLSNHLGIMPSSSVVIHSNDDTGTNGVNDADAKDNDKKDKAGVTEAEIQGQDEARRYVRSFTMLQTWVLSLPDQNDYYYHDYSSTSANFGEKQFTTSRTGNSQSSNSDQITDATSNNIKADVTESAEEISSNSKLNTALETVLKHAKGLESSTGTTSESTTNNASVDITDNSISKDEGKGTTSLDTKVHVIPNTTTASNVVSTSTTHNNNSKEHQTQYLQHSKQQHYHYQNQSHLVPPSAKPELLSLSFALLVHTYCELLECGLEYTAASLLSTYRHIYEAQYKNEMLDLDRIATTAAMVELNENVTETSKALAEVRSIRNQLVSTKRKCKDAEKQLQQQTLANQSSSNATSQSVAATQAKASSHAALLTESRSLEQKYSELTKHYTKINSKLDYLPFLRRARALRWQISLSSISYAMLCGYLRREALLPMSILLQSRCHLYVEKRDPIPFTPACILEDMVDDDNVEVDDGDDGDDLDKKKKRKNDIVRWATPIHPLSRAATEGEDISTDPQSILQKPVKLPFPKYYTEAEYDTMEEYEDDKRRVEFNRALLINGFRRLEALEIKKEYEVGMRRPKGSSNSSKGSGSTTEKVEFGNPLAPSVLLSTLCASTSSPSNVGGVSVNMNINSILEEAGIDVTCAKLCPPDGRRVATGCDDAAVRIWSMDSIGHNNAKSNNKGVSDTHDVKTPGESSLILLGHKNGFPVFDVDWNRDARTLLSAGGDGTLRLWDTMAVGPFGKLANVVKRSTSTTHAGGNKSTTISSSPKSTTKASKGSASVPKTHVPGARAEPMVEVNGAALSVYRGHTPSTPVWSAAFAPSGYYFASAGSDTTARLWTTDRPTPVRIFAGHFSPSVNTVTWHPNCNYILTGADDKTVRMWDVQTGNCVRLLSGCGAGVNLVRVCPSGRYAAGADYGGVVHIWDLGSGRKVNELRHSSGVNSVGSTAVIIHSMSYSACGTALATGGDDCTVRIWDARGLGSHTSNPEFAASQAWGQNNGSMGITGASRAKNLGSSRRPLGEQFQPGARTPVKVFRSRRTMFLDLNYTKRNLLLSVGKYTSSAPLRVVSITD